MISSRIPVNSQKFDYKISRPVVLPHFTSVCLGLCQQIKIGRNHYHWRDVLHIQQRTNHHYASPVWTFALSPSLDLLPLLLFLNSIYATKGKEEKQKSVWGIGWWPDSQTTAAISLYLGLVLPGESPSSMDFLLLLFWCSDCCCLPCDWSSASGHFSDSSHWPSSLFSWLW